MRRIRVIPVLLIQNGGLVKSIKFKKHKYVGDPINAVKIFNDKEVDEIAILDISASKEKRAPNIEKIKEFAAEAFMPMAYGGGITTLDQIKRILFEGVEKVVLNTSALKSPDLITQGAGQFGSQSIVVSIDVKKTLFGKYKVMGNCGMKSTGLDPVQFAQKMEKAGAGEIFLTSVDRDGTYDGYDIDLIQQVADSVNIPVIACGGAAKVPDFYTAVSKGKASAVAAGSLFVFQGPHRAVLINYPPQEQLKKELFLKLVQPITNSVSS
ncbi:MAG: AglZ/HisF2 family acetamidino modification protein [Bacteroidota bacterium]